MRECSAVCALLTRSQTRFGTTPPVSISPTVLRNPVARGRLGRQQHTHRRLLDSLRVKYEIEKPSVKLLALADLEGVVKGRSNRMSCFHRTLFAHSEGADC